MKIACRAPFAGRRPREADQAAALPTGVRTAGGLPLPPCRTCATCRSAKLPVVAPTHLRARPFKDSWFFRFATHKGGKIFRKREKNFSNSPKFYIFTLEMYISKLEIYIFRLEIYIFKLEMKFSDGLERFFPAGRKFFPLRKKQIVKQ